MQSPAMINTKEMKEYSPLQQIISEDTGDDATYDMIQITYIEHVFQRS